MAYKINTDCVCCGSCISVCPVSAISEGIPTYNISDECVECGACASVCPVGAIKMNKI